MTGTVIPVTIVNFEREVIEVRLHLATAFRDEMAGLNEG